MRPVPSERLGATATWDVWSQAQQENCVHALATSAQPAAETDYSARLARGQGRIVVRGALKNTSVEVLAAHEPLRLLPLRQGPAVWCVQAGFGGGLVAGDCISVEAEARAGATLVLTSAGGVKAFHARGGGWSQQRLQAVASENSVLANVPAVLTPYRDARVRVETRIELQDQATLIWAEAISAGRSQGMNERWQAAALENIWTLTRDGVPLLRERLRLSPEQGPLAQRMGNWACFGHCILSGPAAREQAARLVAHWHERPAGRLQGILVWAAPLGDDGVLLRAACNSVRSWYTLLEQSLQPLAALCGGLPWQRLR